MIFSLIFCAPILCACAPLRFGHVVFSLVKSKKIENEIFVRLRFSLSIFIKNSLILLSLILIGLIIVYLFCLLFVFVFLIFIYFMFYVVRQNSVNSWKNTVKLHKITILLNLYYSIFSLINKNKNGGAIYA